MPPKRIAVQPAKKPAKAQGYMSNLYNTLTSEENASVVISVAMFGAAVAFFASDYSMDFLQPGF